MIDRQRQRQRQRKLDWEFSKFKMKKLKDKSETYASKKGKRQFIKQPDNSSQNLVSILKNSDSTGFLVYEPTKSRKAERSVHFDANPIVITVQSFKKYNTQEDELIRNNCCSRCKIF